MLFGGPPEVQLPLHVKTPYRLFFPVLLPHRFIPFIWRCCCCCDDDESTSFPSSGRPDRAVYLSEKRGRGRGARAGACRGGGGGSEVKPQRSRQQRRSSLSGLLLLPSLLRGTAPTNTHPHTQQKNHVWKINGGGGGRGGRGTKNVQQNE